MEHRNKKVKPNASSSDWNMMKQNKFINILVNWNRLVLSLYWILTTVLIKWNMVVNFFNDDFLCSFNENVSYLGKTINLRFLFAPLCFYLQHFSCIYPLCDNVCCKSSFFFNQHVHHIKTFKKIVLTWEFLLYIGAVGKVHWSTFFADVKAVLYIGAYVHIRV